MSPDVAQGHAVVDLSILGLLTHPRFLIFEQAAHLHRVGLDLLIEVVAKGHEMTTALKFGEPDDMNPLFCRQLQERVGEQHRYCRFRLFRCHRVLCQRRIQREY